MRNEKNTTARDSSQQSNFFPISIIYSIAHIWIFTLGGALYWDDWFFYGAPSSWVYQGFKDAGGFLFIQPLIFFTFDALGMWAHKFATFSIGLAIAQLFSIILQRDLGFSQREALWVAALASVLPFNIARVALINFSYMLGVLLFLCGWVALEKRKTIAAIFFVLAFSTQSLLVFYIFPFSCYLKHFCFDRSNRKNKFHLFIFFLLPFVWFIIKNLFFVPEPEIYRGYQKISFINVGESVLAQYTDFKEYLSSHFGNIILDRLGLSMGFSALALSMIRCRAPFSVVGFKTVGFRFGLGASMVIFGCFAYWSIGEVPTFSEWTSRHQLLMPFGFAVLIFTVICATPYFIRGVIMSLVIGASATVTANNYSDFRADWRKQEDIVLSLSQSNAAMNCKLMVFKDWGAPFAIDRILRSYEWTGLVHRAFPNDVDRVGISLAQLPYFRAGAFDAVHLNRMYSSHQFSKDSLRDGCLVLITQDGDGHGVVVSGVDLTLEHIDKEL